MYNLSDISFIIPVRFDSKDRKKNFVLSIKWLQQIHPFRIIVIESDKNPQIQDIKNYIDISTIDYVFQQDLSPVFHRTKILNDMLEKVNTKLTCTFDCDVILEKKNFDTCIDKFNAGYDCVYPYGFGFSQIRIHGFKSNHGVLPLEYDFETFYNKFKSNELEISQTDSHYGHAFIINTCKYKSVYGENELFISYGPEDAERVERFRKLDLKVCHLQHENYVYHLEHIRHNNSNTNNPFFKNNVNLFNELCKFGKEDLVSVYKSYKYVQERKFGE